MLAGIDRVMLAVSDLEAGVDHYARLLGRAPAWRGTASDGEVGSAIFRLANGSLQLLSPRQAGAPVAATLERFLAARGDGLYGLIFATGDADVTLGELRTRGLAASEPVTGGGVGSEGFGDPSWRNVILPPSAGRGVLILACEATGDDEVGESPAGAPDGEVVLGIDHVVVYCHDADASSALYRDALGIRLALDKTFPERGLRLVFFRVGGVTLELVQSLDPNREVATDRLGGIAWKVASVPAIRQRLLRQGFEVSEDRAGHKPGTRVCTVQSDTHGVPTLLIDAEG